MALWASILAPTFGVSGVLALLLTGHVGAFVVQTLVLCPLILWAGKAQEEKRGKKEGK